MFNNSNSFSSFSVDDLEKATDFYSQTLGLEVNEEEMGNLMLYLNNGAKVLIYPKGKQHAPANFTILNFLVQDIDSAVEQLANQEVKFEQYDDDSLPQDEKGVFRGLSSGNGPDIAWFKDPAGNILSIIQEK